MVYTRLLIILTLLTEINFSTSAQIDTVLVDNGEIKYCNPKLEGMGPSKGIQLTYERAFDASITSVAEDPAIGNASGTVRRNNFFQFEGKLPVINKPSFKFLVGWDYSYQEFVFVTDEGLDYPLYTNIQQKHLKTIGLNVSSLKSIGEFNYIVFQIRGDLNGDYSVDQLPTADFFKASVTAMYGIKRCPTKTHGYGLYWSYSFGRQRILPAFLYNNTFNKSWGIEMVLPAFAKLRYNINRSTLFYLGAQVNGASYNLVFDNPPLRELEDVQLRKSGLRYFLEFNREIYDFIWFGLSAGLEQNLNFSLTEERNRGTRISFKEGIQILPSEQLIESRIAPMPYISASLFIVPPRKLEQKILNAR